MKSPAKQESTGLRDSSAPLAGLFLIITAIVTLIAVVARVAANTDQPTLPESLAAIADSRVLYGVGGAARFISGVTLLLAAWFLMRSWLTRQRHENPLVSAFFALSGVLTAVSGACALALAASVPAGAITEPIGAATETVSQLRSLFGKIGFAVSGLAVAVAAWRQWKTGPSFRKIAVFSAVLGIAMQFIWWDAATIVHRITGIAFLVWLILVGFMFITGRIERHFIATPDSPSKP